MLESEQSETLLASVARERRSERGKGKAKEEGEGGEEGAEESVATGRKRRAPGDSAAPKARKKSKYCICREERTGHLVECDACRNWFHFECIGLDQKGADKIGACNQ
jgi:hypothetical protein